MPTPRNPIPDIASTDTRHRKHHPFQLSRAARIARSHTSVARSGRERPSVRTWLGIGPHSSQTAGPGACRWRRLLSAAGAARACSVWRAVCACGNRAAGDEGRVASGWMPRGGEGTAGGGWEATGAAASAQQSAGRAAEDRCGRREASDGLGLGATRVATGQRADGQGLARRILFRAGARGVKGRRAAGGGSLRMGGDAQAQCASSDVLMLVDPALVTERGVRGRADDEP
ncbi:hypothetical protein GGX14DRAFT_397530 [Mycena pura]|uniref:Uncharacterized protein n=1 Tax=Mycena pura TaxID=153505 RepID=A0AAD6VAQ7_9AGAR|nr:hypothetical protein GGX14DRAFT_397530 [Mycena pura]